MCMGLFHMCCITVAWVSFCRVPYLRSENNLRRFDFLRHRRFNWCKKVQVGSSSFSFFNWQVLWSYCWQLFIISCFFFVSAIGLLKKFVSSTWVSQHWKLFQVEELKREVVNEMWTNIGGYVNQKWRSFEKSRLEWEFIFNKSEE